MFAFKIKMNLLSICAFILMICNVQQRCDCGIADSQIYFEDEIRTFIIRPTTAKTTTTTTAKIKETTLETTTERKLWSSFDFQEQSAARAEIICNREFSVPEPKNNPALSKSENKCAEWRHVMVRSNFYKERNTECEWAMAEAGWEFVTSGKEAKPGEFPHMAAIGWPSKEGGYVFKCGGSLISEKYVMTAGHCLVSSRDTTLTSLEPTIVRLGDQNILDKAIDGLQPQQYRIVRVIRHPDYNSPKKYNDIALLELEGSVWMGDNVRPACLWNKLEFDFDKAIITGWGVTEVGNLKQSPDLLKATVDLIENNQCDDLLHNRRNRHWQGLVESQVCAGVLTGGPDTCQGDSGGPLQMKEESDKFYHILGVTSFGFQCGSPNTPGVYTRVSEFVPWIESVIWT